VAVEDCTLSWRPTQQIFRYVVGLQPPEAARVEVFEPVARIKRRVRVVDPRAAAQRAEYAAAADESIPTFNRPRTLRRSMGGAVSAGPYLTQYGRGSRLGANLGR